MPKLKPDWQKTDIPKDLRIKLFFIMKDNPTFDTFQGQVSKHYDDIFPESKEEKGKTEKYKSMSRDTYKSLNYEIIHMPPEEVITLPIALQYWIISLRPGLALSIEAIKTELEKAEQAVPEGPQLKQKPHQETPHEQKMRELARKLTEIRLPSVMDSFEMRQKGHHCVEGCDDDVFFTTEMDGREIAAYADFEGLKSSDHENAEANYQWRALFNHLMSSGFSGVIDKIKYFDRDRFAYFKFCDEFLNLIKKEIEDDTRLWVPYKDSAHWGFTPLFPTLIAVNSLQTEQGSPSYMSEATSKGWELSCNFWVIFIGDSKETLEKYEKLHKDLTLKWAEANKSGKIKAATERNRLEIIVEEVRIELSTFAGKEHLPGHCDLDDG